MPVKISHTNSKLGLIPSVNLPPVVTCRENCPCSKDCYALKGRYRFPNVKNNNMCNLQQYLSNPAQYFAEIQLSINNGMVSYSFFRWHAAGDIVDRQYFLGMVELAQRLPNTAFLAFTKKFEIINKYVKDGGVIPSNLNIVFSAWGDDFKIKNPYRFPVAYVRFPDETKNKTIPKKAVECSGDCTKCLQCWKITKGEAVVFNQH